MNVDKNSSLEYTVVKPSTEKIILYLKTLRDNRLKELLSADDALMDFLEEQYNTLAISAVKREFIKRDLAELKSTSLDLVHYSSLIKEIKEHPEFQDAESHPLFIQELKAIFKKYGFYE